MLLDLFGDRSLGLNPFIREADSTGQFLADIPITNNIKMDKDNKHGFRNNLALVQHREGMHILILTHHCDYIE